ncbi:MAG: hypothetical protein AB1403_20865, partial [Candidatus Riflebacteria bacterium]
LIRTALAEIEGHPDPVKRSELIGFLVKVSLEINQIAQGRDLIEKIETEELKARALIDFCAKLAAIDDIKEAVESAGKIISHEARIHAFMKIIEMNPDNRNFKIKSDLLNQIIEIAGKLPAGPANDRILAECARIVAGSERFHKAFQILEGIKDSSVQEQLIWDLVQMKLHRDFFMEGMEIIRLIRNADTRISRLIQVGLALLQNQLPACTFKPDDFLPVAFSFWLEERQSFESSIKPG